MIFTKLSWTRKTSSIAIVLAILQYSSLRGKEGKERSSSVTQYRCHLVLGASRPHVESIISDAQCMRYLYHNWYNRKLGKCWHKVLRSSRFLLFLYPINLHKFDSGVHISYLN